MGARDLLAEFRATCAKLGAALALARADALAVGLAANPADGRSDREIAAASFISPTAVGHHVASILAERGLESRTAAAAHAHRHGLV